MKSEQNTPLSIPHYTANEEIFNIFTHAAGSGAAIVGLVLLCIKALSSGNKLHLVSSLIYGISLIILYTTSALYHAHQNPKYRSILRVCDHSTIFVLIAGTYTPYMLSGLHSVAGIIICSALWLLTILGIVLNYISLERFKKLSMVLYIAMGWCIILVIKPVVDMLGFGGTALLFVGGIAYTGGIVFYNMKNIQYMHSIWHMFVLTGSVLQYLSIYYYVIK